MYFTNIGEAVKRPLNQSQTVIPSRPTPQQRQIGPVSQQPQPQQQMTPQQQQMIQQQQKVQQQQIATNNVPNKLNAVAMNKRQIPNGSKNTVNALRQAQQPLNIRK